MEIRIIAESDIGPQLDSQIRDLLCRCFPQDVERYSKTRYFNRIVPAWNVLTFDEAEIVGGVAVVDKTIFAAGSPFRIAGVGNVCVLSEYRGAGLADKMLITAMAQALQQDFDFGMLFCDAATEHVYARTGWSCINPAEIIHTEDDGAEIKFSYPHNDHRAMYYRLKDMDLPAGVINLNGNYW